MKNRICIVIALICVLFSSCKTERDFVYLKDMELGVGYPFDTDYEAEVHSGDRLNIVVSSKTPELAIPFNVNGGTFQVDKGGNVQTNTATAKGGYKVDKHGDILFPVLGKLHVDGMKVSEVSELIRTKIIEKKYIKEPIVNIDFLNFKYTILGAVGSNGSRSVEGDRVTLLEAIAQAGNLDPNARLDRILVIREEGGERKVYQHDIRSKSLFKSPCFYLKQNDVIYVEPDKKPQGPNPKEDRFFKYLTVIMSLITATTSILWLTTK